MPTTHAQFSQGTKQNDVNRKKLGGEDCGPDLQLGGAALVARADVPQLLLHSLRLLAYGGHRAVSADREKTQLCQELYHESCTRRSLSEELYQEICPKFMT